MPPLRIIFFGTADLACPSLEALTAEPGLELVAVVSQPDRPKGRAMKLAPPPVKVLAQQRNLPVYQPRKARDPEFLAALAGLNPDLIALAAYGQILPPALLDLPRHGCLNVHPSLLPRHRGPSPIQSALLEGDAETGVTIMKMDAGLDTGDIVCQRRVAIRPADTALTLHQQLAQLGGRLLAWSIPGYLDGSLPLLRQPVEGMTLSRKITKEDGLIDWTLPAGRLWNRVRALTPWPGTFTFFLADGQRRLLKVHEAMPVPDLTGPPGIVLRADKGGWVVACGDGGLRLDVVQREGGRPVASAAFLAGMHLAPGDKLG